MATPEPETTRRPWGTLLATAALAAILVVHVACWRALTDSLRRDEPAMLVALVGLERSLEGLQDAVARADEADAAAGTVTAARAAVVDRVERLVEAGAVDRTAVAPRVFAEVERALRVTRARPALGADAGEREAARAAIARAHAEVRESVLAAQQRSIAWSRGLDRQIAWLVTLASVLWIGVGAGLLALAASVLRHRREVSNRLRGVQQALVRSEHEARHDPLTGLANRRVFDTELREAIRAARSGGEPFALHLVDVDGLKAVNDGLGHAAGDALLAAVAAALGRCVRARDLVARFGGDEFALIQRDATPESVRILARRLREAVARPTALGEQQRTTVPEVSIGSALYADDADDAATLVRAADARLYAQKRRRRDDRSGVDPVTLAAPLPIAGR